MAISRSQQIISILWPSFLTAALGTILFFAAFDPIELLSGTALADLSPLGAYTIGFFSFWLLAATSSALTTYFQRPTDSG